MSRPDHPLSDAELAALFDLSIEEMSGLGIEVAPELQAEATLAPLVADDAPAEQSHSVDGRIDPGRDEAPTGQARSARPPTPLHRVVISTREDSIDSPTAPAAGEHRMSPAAAPFLPIGDILPGRESPESGLSADLVAAFAEESSELLDGFHVELEALERAAEDWNALREARRVVHTLKGAAAVCGYERVVRVAHACEDVLEGALKAEMPLSAASLRLLFDTEPVLRTAVDASVSGNASPAPSEAETAIIARLREDRGAPEASMAAPPPRQADGDESIGVPVHEEDNSAAAAETGQSETLQMGASAVSRSSGALTVPVERIDELVDKVTEVLGNRAGSQEALSRLVKQATDAGATAQRLQRLVSAIAAECAVIGLTMPAPSEETSVPGPGTRGVSTRLQTLLVQLEEATSDQAAVVAALKADIVSRWTLGAAEQRLNTDVLSMLLGVRLVPLDNLRVRLDRAVRSAAATTGKPVALSLQGGHFAVEKNVFDRLFEPLMHLIRNSVDHGIEAPIVRQQRGKPPVGSIALTASEVGNEFIVRMVDDGAGIDPVAVSKQAVQRGIIPASVVATMTDQQKQELIFIHGFSTSATVGDLSGRGIGMDIVRETCTRMGGSLTLSSVPGHGTTVTLRLPTSLSLAHVMVVRDGVTLAAVPANAVRAVHLVPVAAVEQSSRGVAMYLSEVARRDQGPSSQPAIADATPAPLVTLPLPPGAGARSYARDGELHVLEVPYEGSIVGLLVEELVMEDEMVVKPLPALMRSSGHLLGAVFLAGGDVIPMLNLPELLRYARPAQTLTAANRDGAKPRALVVDDSLSMRVALTETLDRAGFAVDVAPDGRQALEMIGAQGMPDVITLDVEMPRMNGLEALNAIRHSPGGSVVPIFMISSRSAAHHRRAAYELGATRFYTKPFPVDEVIAAARAAIGRQDTAAVAGSPTMMEDGDDQVAPGR